MTSPASVRLNLQRAEALPLQEEEQEKLQRRAPRNSGEAPQLCCPLQRRADSLSLAGPLGTSLETRDGSERDCQVREGRGKGEKDPPARFGFSPASALAPQPQCQGHCHASLRLRPAFPLAEPQLHPCSRVRAPRAPRLPLVLTCPSEAATHGSGAP